MIYSRPRPNHRHELLFCLNDFIFTDICLQHPDPSTDTANTHSLSVRTKEKGRENNTKSGSDSSSSDSETSNQFSTLVRPKLRIIVSYTDCLFRIWSLPILSRRVV